MISGPKSGGAPRRSMRLVLAGPAVCALLAGCGGGTSTPSSSAVSSSGRSAPSRAVRVAAARVPAYPVVMAGAADAGLFGWRPGVSVRGHVAAWISRVPATGDQTVSITLLRFDQSVVRLALHAGSGSDPGGSGWTYGPAAVGSEKRRLVAGFNGAFHLHDRVGGFMENGRTAAPMQPGGASIVTYRNGMTDIGSWGQEVPAAATPVFSVRQNLKPLIDRGRAAPTVDSCRICWGPTLGGVDNTARAGLGITANGQLVWAGGERLSVTALTNALLSAGAQRAAELDINPEWVVGFLYRHHPSVTPLALIPGQWPQPGSFLTPYDRDFFTVIAR